MTNSIADIISYFDREDQWAPMQDRIAPRQISDALFIRHCALESELYSELVEEIVHPQTDQLNREVLA